MHHLRADHTAELAPMAEAGDWEGYYRHLMLEDFPHESRMGWQLAFLRPFAVPRMAKILVESGHLINDPLKRAYDTALVIYEIVYGGLDSPRGRHMVKLMNGAHKPWPIEAEDMTYVLTAFMVAPLRYIEQTGWRRLTSNDYRSSFEFYSRMGKLMGITHIPQDYADAEAIFDEYEARMVAPSPEGTQLGDKLISVLKDRMPIRLRPVAPVIFTMLLNNPPVARALGLTPLPQPVQQVVLTGMRGYGLIVAWTPPRTRPIFTPGNKAGKAYPEGYTLDQVGPYGTAEHTNGQA